MDLEQRKLKILEAIIDTYIITGEPVSSKVLCNILDFGISSATIRNEMAELTQLGFLEQPHTSAGRIPSHLGYRFYINKIMNRKPISKSEQLFIDHSLSGTGSLDQLLEETVQMLAGITKFAAISTTPSENFAQMKSIQFIPLGKHTATILLITSSGIIKNKMFRCDYELTPEITQLVQNVLNQKLNKVALQAITPAFIQTLAASLGEFSILFSSILMAIYEAAQEALSIDIKLEGQSNLLFVPDFSPQSLQQIMEFLNCRAEISKFLTNHLHKIHVVIGKENERSELSHSSLIIAKYSIGRNSSGIIGILGPTRMDYANLIPKVEYLASTVEQILNRILEIEES